MDKLEGVFAIRATKESARECLQEKMCFYTIIKLAIVFFWFVSCFLWFLVRTKGYINIKRHDQGYIFSRTTPPHINNFGCYGNIKT